MERTGDDAVYWRKAQDNVELAPGYSSSHAPPNMPFKSDGKRVPKGRQGAAVVIILKKSTNTPVPDSINPGHADRLNGMKRPLRGS
jgi:hypothetical protein